MVRTQTGFAGGDVANPTYQQVCTKTTGHAETVAVTYDPSLLTARALLTEFFTLHDATRDRRTGYGKGQYRSAIFYTASMGPAELTSVRAVLEDLHREGLTISTEFREITAFYPAASRHQQYCSAKGITPKKRDSARIREILTLE